MTAINKAYDPDDFGLKSWGQMLDALVDNCHLLWLNNEDHHREYLVALVDVVLSFIMQPNDSSREWAACREKVEHLIICGRAK